MRTLQRDIYRRTAQGWALCFIGVGALFALLPAQVGRGLQGLAGWLGLHGHVEVGAGSLWHVLALSLMVAVTGLAWLSARSPEDKGPYAVLMAAKIASTLVFLWLARGGSAWLLCAVADGFVAATLAWTRRGVTATTVQP